ncbi:MAG: FAD-binding protein [Candidatus Lokiarchaeota archaeon]|nr:FAD-binding protein [Candidatus Lokiarchaeota archaeon]
MKLRDIAIGANASMYYRLNFKMIKGVFYPKNEQEVIQAISTARKMDVSITPKGGGSGLSGACTGGNDERIMLSSLGMTDLLTISKDSEQPYIDVQPGATPDEINAFLEPHGMKLWVAPSSRDIATVGGILSTDGGGNDTWVNGTMRDNTLRVTVILHDGSKLVIDNEGVTSENKSLAERLNKAEMNIHDIAASHGTLGFITELRLAIKPFPKESLVGGLAHFDDATDLGTALTEMIEKKSKIRYGESIVAAHEDVRGSLKPPLLILQFPDYVKDEICDIVDLEELDNDEIERMKDIRIKLPKRNPKQGNQIALFEGYGFYENSLRKMQDGIDSIDNLLREHGLEPFAKYGHAPSKWYLGDNTPAYGIVMHSREIRPDDATGRDLFDTVLNIVKLTEKLEITPKPEHKWPFSDKSKLKRMIELREIIGGHFNDFLFDPHCDDVLSSMV